MYWSVLLCVVSGVGYLNGDRGEDAPGPVAVSPSGQFLGSWMTSRRGRLLQAYRGIRYAEPPVGPLRFQPPVRVLQYEGVVNATADGPLCPQPPLFGFPAHEDCLYINVYTPHNRCSLLPVIVYLHAGGFYAGTGRSEFAGPEYLLDRNLVLVTFNYRLGSFGFLSLGTKEAPGNNGFKDQVAALQWVARNIKAFGGDPGLVTIAGCSAGSLSVMLHMISPMSQGLFHRAISMSGSPVSKVPSPTHRLDLATTQARMVDCPVDNTTALYHCLNNKTSHQIAGTLLPFFEFGYDPLSLWRPVVEPDFGQERFLPVEPLDAIRERNMRPVPYIITMTRDEFFWKAYTILKNQTLLTKMEAEWEKIAPISFILPRGHGAKARDLRLAYMGSSKVAQAGVGLGKLYGDSITAFPVHRLANLMCQYSEEPVYYGVLTHLGNHSHYRDPVMDVPVGVAHHDDLLYVFTLKYNYPPIPVGDTPDSRMVDIMTTMWYNFARYGDPNPRPDTPELNGVSWLPMKPDNRRYLKLQVPPTLDTNLFEERFKIWEQLYPVSP